MMTNKEKKLLAALLKMTADEFSNHGCNDFDVAEAGLTEEDSNELWDKLAEWGDPELADCKGGTYHYDCVLMKYFADKILED